MADDPGRAGAPAPEREALKRILDDPNLRAGLETLLAESAEIHGMRRHWRRLRDFVAAVSGAAMMLLAFFIPSIQDQWDRFQARRVVDRYVDLGRSLAAQAHYEVAEQAFAKAIELSDNKRVDIEEEQLRAKVQRIYANPNWGDENPEDVEESDFLYLLELQRGKPDERATTLNAMGVFLASLHRWRESEAALREATGLKPSDATAWLHLGNLYRDLDRASEAEEAYRKSLSLAPNDARGHYNLGLLLVERGRAADAEASFRNAVRLAPEDTDALARLAETLESSGRAAEARAFWERAVRLDPEEAEIAKGLERTGGRKRDRARPR